MINTKGAPIEPRVGDVVRVIDHHQSLEWEPTIIEVTERDFVAEDETHIQCVDTASCEVTLIRRPFQVGDEVVYSPKARASVPFASSLVFEITNPDKVQEGVLVHKNPDWRGEEA